MTTTFSSSILIFVNIKHMFLKFCLFYYIILEATILVFPMLNECNKICN